MFDKDRLKELIDRNGITQQQLADAIGLSHVSIYYYVEGKKTPGTRTLQKIANYFNVTTDYLLGVSDDADLTGKQYSELRRKFNELIDILEEMPKEKQDMLLEMMSAAVGKNKK